MAKFTVEYAHAHAPEEVKKRVIAMAGSLAKRYGISVTWAASTFATWTVSGGAGSISCEPGKVRIDVDLGPFLGLMRTQIEQGLREELRAALA